MGVRGLYHRCFEDRREAPIGRVLHRSFRRNPIPKKMTAIGRSPARQRHTLATELLGNGATFEDVADVLGNSPEIVRKHYAKWSPARQARIDELMEKVHAGIDWIIRDKTTPIQ